MGDFCSIAKPFRPSSEAAALMEDRDKRAILSHNAYGASTCGWKP